MNFKIGDVVRTKAGGPKMTIVGFVGDSVVVDERVKTRWFVHDELRSGQFPPEALILQE